jgi:hypothetical protein
MSEPYRINFAADLDQMQRDAVAAALAGGLHEADRFGGYQRGVKTFYRIPSAAGPLFVKARRFDGLLKRLGRTLRPTKARREFDNLLALAERGVPCPQALAVARRFSGPLIRESVLVQRFLPDAVPLSRALLADEAPRDLLLDRLLEFLRLLRDRGVVHRDLHWDNVLVVPASGGPELMLIDSLHVRFEEPPAAAKTFAVSVVWLLAFMIHQSAPREIIDGVLDRVPQLDIAALADRDALRRRARDAAARL